MLRLPCVTALLLLLCTSARADAPNPSNQDKAKAHYVLGVDFYDRADYDHALEEFQMAHELSMASALYFNMAACEEHLHHFKHAVELLRKYLDENPGADDRASIEGRIGSLKQRADKSDVAPAATPQPWVVPPTVPPPPRVDHSVSAKNLHATWAMVGVTGALGITAVALGSYTVVHHGDLKSGCGHTSAGCSSSQISGLKATANAADAFIALTVASAVVTAIVAAVEVKHARQRAVAFTGTGMVF